MNPVLSSLQRDVRQAARSLWREKAFSATVLATFALCLGANVVIFTVVHSILFAPLPFEHPEELVIPDNSYPKLGMEHSGASVSNYYEWRGGSIPAFFEIGGLEVRDGLIGEAGAPERVQIAYATPSFFRVLGARAAIGRLFMEEEGSYGGGNHWNVAVISDSFWRQRFGADPEAIGKVVRIEGVERTIVGVLPPGFRYLETKAPVWIPLIWTDAERSPRRRHWNSTHLVARLAPEATIEQAQGEIDALNGRLSATDPSGRWAKKAGFLTTVRGLHAAHVEQVRPALLLLQGGVLLLLFVGIVNVMNLFLVRASARAKEFSLRQVLGAGRLTVALRLATETTFMAVVGAGIGIGLAAAALQFIGRLGVDRLPLGADVRLDAAVVAAALIASILIGLVLAVPPVLFANRTDFAAALASEGRSGTTSRGTHRLRHALIVAQIALAFVLLTGAGLLALSFRRVLAVDPGFRPSHVLSGWVGLPWSTYKDGATRVRFAERWLQRIDALPGIAAVGLSSDVPMEGGLGTNILVVQGHEPGPGEMARAHHTVMVAGDYFAALRIAVREGRPLETPDFLAGRKVCVIDEDFARLYWPHESPIGHLVAMTGNKIDENSLRIVGVVGRVKHGGLSTRDNRGTFYYPMTPQFVPYRMATVVRSAQPPATLAPELRRTLLDVDPMLPLDDVQMMDTRIEESLMFPRSLMLTSTLFAALALLLSAVGVYGVMAYSVAQRRREIGVRMALGALPGQILTQFMRRGGNLLGAGLLFGVGASVATGRLMQSLLFDVSPGNPAVYGAAAAALGAVVMVATLLPSCRAAATSVMESLRRD